MTLLRLDPECMPLWRDGTTLQFGTRAVAALRDPAPWQERVIAQLERGVEAAHLEAVAAAHRVPPGAVAELLELLAPALRTVDPKPEAAVVAADGVSARLVGDVIEGLEGSGWDATWCAPGEAPSRVRDGRDAPLPVVLLAAHALPPHLWTPLLRDDVPHLPVVFSGSGATVGPLVLPGRTACLSCLAAHERERDPAWPTLVTQLLARPAPEVPLPLAMEATSLAARLLAEMRAADPHASERSRSVRIGDRTRRLWRSHRPHAECLCRSALLTGVRRSPSGSATAAEASVPSPAPTTATAFARPA